MGPSAASERTRRCHYIYIYFAELIAAKEIRYEIRIISLYRRPHVGLSPLECATHATLVHCRDPEVRLAHCCLPKNDDIFSSEG